MKYSDSHEEMTPQEQHGIQLRMAADELVQRTDELVFDSIVAVINAENLLDAIHEAATR